MPVKKAAAKTTKAGAAKKSPAAASKACGTRKATKK